MELVTPEYSLLAWTTLCLFSLTLSITVLVQILRNNRLTPIESLGWITFVFLVPVIGPVVYFTRSRTSNKYV
ncbi:MAG TPA: PLD nuclease N-terminal domain-containing protein [Flavisolibacter sp.]|nr:PLD nuclease N-terminal domain-containing protein [Flavisolibacter sp.]